LDGVLNSAGGASTLVSDANVARAADEAENAVAAAGGGGPNQPAILYKPLDELGRPTGVEATLTQDLLDTGSAANRSIIPPGFEGGAAGQARGHLLANRLGGSGQIPENLVTLQQVPVNTPVMRGFEAQIYNAVSSGQTVSFTSTPLYNGANLIPRGVTLTAEGSGGFSLGVTILNPIGF
jgi:hypothetical protein